MNQINHTEKLEYISPKLQISAFDAADVIRTSGIQLPFVPLFGAHNDAAEAQAYYAE